MIYVALLRGINVGGKARVEMAKLRSTFESISCRDVSTYINSGNVVFQDDRSVDLLTPLIESAIEKHFNASVRVVVRDMDNIRQLCTSIPFAWTNDDNQKTDVLFLWKEIDNDNLLRKIAINQAIENVRYLQGALVWNISRANATRGAGLKLMKTGLYKNMTVRNINTVRKLYSLMQAMELN